jgi:[ribosomal protein S18]-alanine N-acetyltransferase
VNDTVHIDDLRPGDVARCAELERILFPGDDPWTERAFRDELRAGHHYLAARIDTARSLGGARIDTARSGPARRHDASTGTPAVEPAVEHGELVGYAGLAFIASAPHAEAEIHTIGVDPAHQHRGIGRALLRGLLGVADAAAATVFLEVRTDNAAAHALYEAEGFAVVGIRKRYYRPSGADAHTMRRDPR